MATKTVNISLPEKLLKEIDLKARRGYLNRSELLKQAALQYLRRQNDWDEFRMDAARRAKKLGIKTEDDVEDLIDEGRS